MDFQIGDMIWHKYYRYYALVVELPKENEKHYKTIKIQPLNYGDNEPFWLGNTWAKKVS